MTVLTRDLSKYAQEAYRDYALYVLLDRALARYSDGLKPVQRRILFAMHELHLGPQAKPKKSVRAIGDALGKYHPHSDQAGYEALVALAQGFAIRYPLIEGQGNFGSIDDPKSFASMRYTEVRLSSYSPLLFTELSLDSVQWQQNFDGTLTEPVELPAQLPVLLLNGCSGIAVGLSTEIPPHHMGECIDALLHFIKNPGVSLESLLKHMPGPDFPGGGILRSSAEGLIAFYREGKGHFQIEALIEQEGTNLIIKEIPYMTMTSRILEQLQLLNQAKPSTAPFDLIDESDEQSPVRVVLNFKTSAAARAAIPVLLEKTDCSLSYRCYFNALDDSGAPRCFSLKEFFAQWVEYRQGSLLAQFQARQLTVAARRTVLHVYKVGFHAMDQIFSALQRSEDPWGDLKKSLKFSDQEIEILSALRLKELSKLSLDRILQEEKDLIDENAILVDRIVHREKRISFISEQVKRLKHQYADRRRTEILGPREKFSIQSQIPAQPKEDPKLVWILLTQFGWIKMIRPPKFGSEIDFSTHCRQGDAVLSTLYIMDDQEVVFVDHKGRIYSLPAMTTPYSKYGEHLSGLLSLPSGHQIILMTPLCGSLSFVSSLGHGFSVDLESLSLNKRGKLVAKFKEEEQIVWVGETVAKGAVFITSKSNSYGLLPLNLLPVRQSGRGVALWKGGDLIDSIVSFLLGSDTLSLVSTTGRKVYFDPQMIQIKRGQALKVPARKSSTLVKNTP